MTSLAEPTTGAELWSDRLAELTTADAGGAGPIVCASGISPSGPIHMGNLREVLTTHFVAEALRRRGVDAVHLHSWDDYDRLRKVPDGVDPSFERYVGMPLGAIPDPFGSERSWADRFIRPFQDVLERLGVDVLPRRQSELYPAGEYNAPVRLAMEQRGAIFDVLAEQQTAGRHSGSVDERRAAYHPFVVYCTVCGKDTTRVLGYAAGVVTWSCRCGHTGEMDLADGAPISGKLVWKVDWPMRWHHEGVRFEPAGEDHQAPTGSFTVGRQLVREIFSGSAPTTATYSFVTLAGQDGKMSGSKGRVVTPGDALSVLEPAVLRWLYARRLPAQSFAIDLTYRGVQQLYDEWDRFVDTATEAPGSVEERTLAVSCESSRGEVPFTRRRAPFRMLVSVADMTQGNRAQMARIVGSHIASEGESPEELLDALQPRLDCALTLVADVLPAQERTVVRESFADDVWSGLDEQTHEGLGMLAAELDDSAGVDDLTTLVYGIPKRLRGLPPDAEPDRELKASQRAFFKAVYLMLTTRETGPRLPTLLLSIGTERAAGLLTAP